MKNLTLSSSSLTLMVNATGTVGITSGNGNYSVVSNNSAIATPTLNGSSISIIGRNAGSATITVTDKLSSKTATISVTVMKNLTLSYSSLSMVIHTNKTVNILSGNGRYSVTTNNPSIVSASITGNSIIVHALNPGNSIITVTDTITSQTAKISVTSSVGVSDYLPYNPKALQVIAENDGKYLLTDGSSRMKMFANREDAHNGMRIAMRHNLHCFVGRSNKRAERKDYIFEFWAGTSGLTNLPLTKTDLLSYNPNNLTAVLMGSSGWSIRDGNHMMFIADNEADAKAIISVLKNYTKVGFIGRDNKRPDRKNYIMTYLE